MWHLDDDDDAIKRKDGKPYDPRHRQFKRRHWLNASSWQGHIAFVRGRAVADGEPVKFRWRTNPYPPGVRHDQYQRGLTSKENQK